MEFPLSPSEKELRDSIRSFARGSLPLLQTVASGPEAVPAALREALSSQRLLETGPEAGRGGEPRSGLASLLPLVEIARAAPALAAALAVDGFLCRSCVRRSGGPDFPAQLLPEEGAARGLGAWGMIERDPGDLTASPVEGGWILDGRQSVLAPAGFFDWMVLTASTGGAEGARADTSFAVERDCPGITWAGPLDTGAGGRALPYAVLDKVAVPAVRLLGCQGGAWSKSREVFAGADVALAGLCSGIAESALVRCLEAATAKGRGRPARNKRAGERLAEALIEMETVRFLSCRAALREGGREGHALEAREAATRGLDLVLSMSSAARLFLASRPDSAAYLSSFDAAAAAVARWAALRSA